MHTDILQPWATVQGSVTDVFQEEEGWLDLSGCSDVALWVDVRAVTPATSTSSVTLLIESSPTHDEAFFRPVATMPLLASSSSPLVVKSVSGAASANPIARWLRWHLAGNSTGVGTWGVTFRVRVARARTPFFTPACVPGCALWFRADLGVTFPFGSGSSSSIAGWSDQTGNGGNNVSPSATCPWTRSSANFNGLPSIGLGYQSAAAYLQASTGVSLGQPSTLIIVAQSNGAVPALQTYVYGGGSNPVSLSETASSTLSVTLNAGTAQAVAVSSDLAASASILQVDWNGASTQVYQNGVAQGGAVNAGGNALTFANIGAGAAGANFLAGSVAEVVAFKPPLTPAWRTLVTRYLGNRYGIVVP